MFKRDSCIRRSIVIVYSPSAWSTLRYVLRDMLDDIMSIDHFYLDNWPSIPISCCYGIVGSRGSVPCIVILKIRILQLFMRSESQFSQKSCICEAVEGSLKVIDVINLSALLFVAISNFFTIRHLCRSVGIWFAGQVEVDRLRALGELQGSIVWGTVEYINRAILSIQ
jgi:hypothetical protein